MNAEWREVLGPSKPSNLEKILDSLKGYLEKGSEIRFLEQALRAAHHAPYTKFRAILQFDRDSEHEERPQFHEMSRY